MQKSEIEYIKKFFNHFGIEICSMQDISVARDEFFSKYGIMISFSEIYKGHRYTDKVFSIYDATTSSEKYWFSDFDEFLSNVLKFQNSKLLLTMPRNLLSHQILIKNNEYRKKLKKLFGYYPDVKCSPYFKPLITCEFSTDSGYDLDFLKNITYMLNGFEEVQSDNIVMLLRGNDKYKITKLTRDTYQFYLYGKVKDFEILLTSLKFAGIKLTDKVVFYTNEETYESFDTIRK
jgi:hypothetical protein